MRLVPVVFKGSRLTRNPKYLGGVLNPDKAFYVYRTEGNNNPMPRCQAQASKRLAKAHV